MSVNEAPSQHHSYKRTFTYSKSTLLRNYSSYWSYRAIAITPTNPAIPAHSVIPTDMLEAAPVNIAGDIVPFDEPTAVPGEAAPAAPSAGIDEAAAGMAFEAAAGAAAAGAAAPIEAMAGAAAPIGDAIAGAAAPIEAMAGELMTGAAGAPVGEAAAAAGVVRVTIGPPGQTGQVTVVTVKPDGT